MVYLDTSVLVSLLVPEPESPSVRNWLGKHRKDDLGTSDWAIVEFASAMGLKVRHKGLKARQAAEVIATLNALVAESLGMQTPSRAAHIHAAALVARFREGLRAGDALHLAVAMDAGADRFVTLDRRLTRAARALKLPIKVVNPL